MTRIIIANIFSLIGASLLLYSTFSKNKSHALTVQIGDCLFNSLGCLVVGSYPGSVTNLMSAFRNFLNAKNKMNKPVLIILILISTIIGCATNTKGLIGILPIIASIQYTVWSSVCKSAHTLKIGLLLNLFIWLTHDVYMNLFTSAACDATIIITTLLNIFWLDKNHVQDSNNP